MFDSEAAKISLVIGVLIVLIIAYIAAWYMIGWSTVTFKTSDKTSAVLKPASGNVTNFKFKNCIFTVYDTDGTTVLKSRNVSNNLSAMAKAYRCSMAACKSSGIATASQSLPLIGVTNNGITTINCMSFTIIGFNDSSTQLTPQEITGYTASLVVNYKETILPF